MHPANEHFLFVAEATKIIFVLQETMHKQEGIVLLYVGGVGQSSPIGERHSDEVRFLVVKPSKTIFLV